MTKIATKMKNSKGAQRYRSNLKKAGLSQLRFADVVGIANRTSQGYALGEVPIPGPVMKLLALLAAGRITAEELEAAR